MALTCPKCAEDLRTYERNGVTIDQCSGCRGVFLDRGELERLIEAESRQYAATPRYRSGHDNQSGSHHSGRRRKGLLGELFD